MDTIKQPQRVDTGVAGLNDILSGGLPAGQMYLLEGTPGTGKTTLAMQFIIQGVKSGEKSLYVTLSESKLELQASARSHGWDADNLPIAEFIPEEASLSPEQQYTVFHPSEVELAATVQKLTELIEQVKPDRLVIDSLSELRLLAADTMRYRRQLLALKQFFAGRDTTVVLLDDQTAEGSDMQLQSIAHGVLRLDKVQRTYGVTRRQIEIVKLRGTAYREGFHDYTIKTGGIRIYPRLIAGEHGDDFYEERVKSGLPELDTMFGGGICRGSSTLLIGPTGAGKSTVALQYACAATARGDRAIVYAFDEVLRIAQDRATALGLDVRRHIRDGNLAMSQVDPAELSPGEFIWQIRSDVEERDTRVVVIDSLNGFLNSMPGERDLILQMHELLAYLSQKGVVTFIIMTQHGLVGEMQTEIDVSYLADTVVLLRYFENEGEIRQVISVLKQRVGRHERTLREFSMKDDSGLAIGEPLRTFRGVLTGVPNLIGRND
ncbi:ATPase domain-containing protein [Granulicella sibirica]|uniref:non-specific serine/threonine protein kinase n=1 Tax=Granulicella sibirica TaxID=2479048 RepID=A0A4Q0T5C8_9BACT|nr:ATPase domain-containing protein [Granulicella sibirica]RXH57229.1 Circadian clock protein KaiC [Granulicella sibirica]